MSPLLLFCVRVFKCIFNGVKYISVHVWMNADKPTEGANSSQEKTSSKGLIEAPIAHSQTCSFSHSIFQGKMYNAI